MYYLNNWTILEQAAADGQVVMRLCGEVFGHPRYEPGCRVVISDLRSFFSGEDSISIVTRSRCEYVLGEPNPTEPDAVARVLRHLQARQAACAEPRV